MKAHHLDQETVERLLVGPVADAQDGPEVLVRLLSAVRAAPRPHELTGEGAALQAFRLAHAGMTPTVTPARPPRRLLTGLLGAKVALAALLAAGTGGIALAAVTGTLPGPLGDEPAPAPSTEVSSRPTPTTDPGVSTTPGALPGDRPGDPAGLTGLCTAYRAEPGGGHRELLATPRFAGLVTAAGGREKVAGYCDRLLDGRDKQNGPTGGVTKRPDAEPTERATSKPTHTPTSPAVTAAPATSRPEGPAVNQPTTVGPPQR